MKHYHFTTVVKNQLDRSREVLLGKSEEYATAQDRLHNFRVAASLQGVSQKEALGGMMAKHTVSIYDMIRDDEDVSEAQWDEKITDHINYLLLLRAMVEEELMVDPGDDEAAVSRNYQRDPAFPPMEDYRTHNAYAPDTGSDLNRLSSRGVVTPESIKTLKERYPDLKIHHTVNYKSKEERDAGKQTSSGVLEERDRESTDRATETTEQG